MKRVGTHYAFRPRRGGASPVGVVARSIMLAFGAVLLLAGCIEPVSLLSDIEEIVEEAERDGQSGTETPPSAPTDLTAEATGPTTVRLEWKDVSDNEDSFQVRRTVVGVSEWSDVASDIGSDIDSYTDESVAAEASYEYQLRARNNAGNSAWSESATVTTPAIPTFTVTYDANGADGGTAPVDDRRYQAGASVTLSGVGTLVYTGHVFVGWDTRSDGTGTRYHGGDTYTMPTNDVIFYARWSESAYELTVVAANGGEVITPSTPKVFVQHGTETAITAEPDDDFSFDRWEVTNGSATVSDPEAPSTTVVLESGDATIEAQFVDTGVPAQPMIVGLIDGTVTNSDLSFTITNTEAGAAVEYTTDGGTNWVSYLSGDITLYAVPDSVDTYSVAARQTDAAGNTSVVEPGEYVSVTIDTEAPGPPEVNRVSLSPTADVTPSWNWMSGSGDGVARFRYRINSGAWIEEDSPDTNFTPASSFENGTYTLRVQERDTAMNWSDDGSASIVVDLRPPSAPVYPSDGSTTRFDGGVHVDLEWQPVPGAVGYTVVVAEDLGFSSVIVNESTSGNSFADSTKLTEGQTYYWYVKTRADGGSSSDDSAIWDFTADHRDGLLGDVGPAGGIVVYDDEIDPDPLPGALRYLEVSPADVATDYDWSSSLTSVSASSTAIGTGQSNTDKIVAAGGATAAYLCDTYSRSHAGIVFDDWFLPSKDELYWVYNTFTYIDGMPSGEVYWSSSEHNSMEAWAQLFHDLPGFPEPNQAGEQGLLLKNVDLPGGITVHVRAVRSF